jgi:hypothetical protein
MLKEGQQVKFKNPFNGGHIQAIVVTPEHLITEIRVGGANFWMYNTELEEVVQTIPFGKMMENLEKRVLR